MSRDEILLGLTAPRLCVKVGAESRRESNAEPSPAKRTKVGTVTMESFMGENTVTAGTIGWKNMWMNMRFYIPGSNRG
jgi:hypothetical protein